MKKLMKSLIVLLLLKKLDENKNNEKNVDIVIVVF